MASAFPSIILSFLFLILPFLSATYAINDEPLHLSSTAYLPKLQAEKLIRGLNLFPTDDVNVATHNPSFPSEAIVEKSFKFPLVGGSLGPSVEELGHHAGYYQLPHSKSAK